MFESCASYTMINEPNGSIGTNGYPNSSYTHNSNCTWIIDLPVRFQSIELIFDGLSLEESRNCVKDQVTILNGISADSLPLGTYCGSQLPATVHSSTRAVMIKFTSDDTINREGFKLNFRGIEERAEGK